MAVFTGIQMRILIFSTPKTGNTWLRRLLETIYEVLPVDLAHWPWPFDPVEADNTEAQFVAHHHYYPSPSLIDWIRRNEVRVLTTIRHPADVLISLYHHVQGFRPEPVDWAFVRSMIHADFERTGVIPVRVGAPFWYDLGCSIAWIDTGLTRVVRYEDLWRDTIGVLQAITDEIQPVDRDRLEMAVERCDVGLMRSLAGPFGGFFRSGSVGAWRDLLPGEIIDDLGSVAPYPIQLAALGYTLDPNDPLMCQPRRQPISKNPFRGLTSFDNGVSITPILVACYLRSPAHLRNSWSPVERSEAHGTFYAWLNEPAQLGTDGSSVPLVSNLAAFIYNERPDLRRAFPDLSGPDRVGFVDWFIEHGRSEYRLHDAFLEPVSAAFCRWANAACDEDPTPCQAGRLTNFALYLYRSRPDLQQAFPDVFKTHKLSFLGWIIENAGSAPDPRIDGVKRALRHSVHQLLDPADSAGTPDQGL